MDMASAADERRIVLLGKTGYGKSSSANTILGEQFFTVGHDPNSQTTECERRDKNIYGKKLAIVDPPGFFDTDRPVDELEMARCITKASPGVHAFLILLQVGRHTDHEEEVVQKITNSFSEEAFKYAVVLFTRGDQLPDGQTIHDFVGKKEKLRTLVQKCGSRCFVLDNKYWNEEHDYRSNKVQVEKLMNTIEDMVAQNGGKYYTNEMLPAVEEAIQREEVVISQESGERLTRTEIRHRAEEAVAWKIKAAGFATGALLGALLGIPVVVGASVVHAAKLLTCLLKILKKGDKVGPAASSLTLEATLPASAPTAAVTETGGMSIGMKWAGVAVVATGAILGANEGLKASQNAKSPGEAAEMAFEAVAEGAKNILGLNTK